MRTVWIKNKDKFSVKEILKNYICKITDKNLSFGLFNSSSTSNEFSTKFGKKNFHVEGGTA